MPSPLRTLCDATATGPDDWIAIDGPESGVGVDYWYRNKSTGAEAYVNDDQGHITIGCGSDDSAGKE